MNELILITGGARSGKSSHAVKMGRSFDRPYFIATATATDNEMLDRIEKHQQERGDRFTTIEAPYDIGRGIHSCQNKADVIVIDCLTVWLGNLLHQHGMVSRRFDEVERFLHVVEQRQCPMVVVSNELGMGLVPETPMGRWFRDVAGRLNQDVARLASHLIFMVSGAPLHVKGCPTIQKEN